MVNNHITTINSHASLAAKTRSSTGFIENWKNTQLNNQQYITHSALHHDKTLSSWCRFELDLHRLKVTGMQSLPPAEWEMEYTSLWNKKIKQRLAGTHKPV